MILTKKMIDNELCEYGPYVPYIFWDARGGFRSYGGEPSDEWEFAGSWWGFVEPGKLGNRFSYELERWITGGPRGGKAKWYKIDVSFRPAQHCIDAVKVAEITMRGGRELRHTIAISQAIQDFEADRYRVKDAWRETTTRNVQTFYQVADDGSLAPFCSVMGRPNDLWMYGWEYQHKGFMPQGRYISCQRSGSGQVTWATHLRTWCSYGGCYGDLAGIEVRLPLAMTPRFPEQYRGWKNPAVYPKPRGPHVAT